MLESAVSRFFDTTKMKHMIGPSLMSPSRTARYRTPNSWKKVSKTPSRTQRCRKLLTITSKTTRRQDGLFPDRTHQNDTVRTIKGNSAMAE
jgi:hypothetical protein